MPARTRSPLPKLARTSALISLLNTAALVVMAACSPSSKTKPQYWSTHQTFDATSQSRVEIVLDRANLRISGMRDSKINVQAQAQEGTRADLSIRTKDQVVTIEQRGGEDILDVDLQIPIDLPVDVHIRQGSLSLQGLTGEINIVSTSAAVTATQIDSELWVTTPRANVTISDSTGEFHILGQAGAIELTNLHGYTSATTIMGEIEYRGRPDQDDLVKIETDHAGVLLRLAPEANARLALKSAGGRIVCNLPGLNETGNDCAATIGAGSALVDIRTVSGPIRIERWLLGP